MVLKVGSSFKVLEETIHITSEYVNTVREKTKVLSNDLRAERQPTLEKDEQFLAAKERVKTIVVNSVKAFQ